MHYGPKKDPIEDKLLQVIKKKKKKKEQKPEERWNVLS